MISRALLLGGGGVSNQLLLTNLFDEFHFVHITFGLPVGTVGPFSVPLFPLIPSGRVLWSIVGLLLGFFRQIEMCKQTFNQGSGAHTVHLPVFPFY